MLLGVGTIATKSTMTAIVIPRPCVVEVRLTERIECHARPQTSFVHQSGDGGETKVRGDQDQVKRLTIIFALLCAMASATTYYVDPAGSNANDGLSPATPGVRC
jgi:hypothetical protein